MTPFSATPSNTPPADEDLAEQAVPGHGIPSQDPDPAAQTALGDQAAGATADGADTLAQPPISAESPPVAAAEARNVAPLLVGGIDAIARSRLFTVPADALLVEVAAQLSNAQISVVVVCGAAGAAMGIVTETLLVRRLGLGQADFFSTRAGDVMTQDFTTCTADALLSDVLAMMHARGLIHVLLMGADNTPIGVLNARDGLRALLAAGNHEEALLRNYVMGIGYQ